MLYKSYLMKILTTYLAFACLIIGMLACQPDDLSQLDDDLDRVIQEAAPGEGRAAFLFPKSNELNRIPQDPNNPLSGEKVTLGQLLYHETGLALNPMREMGTGTYSCASCHFAKAGFQAGRAQGIG